MNHSTGKPTKYEQQRIQAMLELGCVCCAQLGIWNTAVDVQHMLDGNVRMGHWYTLPVCPGHHRKVWTSDQVEIIPPDLRTAISDGSKVFQKHYGTERELWMKVQARLKLPAIWPTTKILPRWSGGNRHVEVDTGSDPDPVHALLRETTTPTILHRHSELDDRALQGSETVTGDTP